MQHQRAEVFEPSSSTRYVVALCRSDRTIAIARLLFANFSIHAWVPKVVNNSPKRGEKRIKSALPGFVFIPREEFSEADSLQKKLLVPQFRPMVLNGKVKDCSHADLVEFENAVLSSLPTPQNIGRKLFVGDEVLVTSGPFKGLDAVVEEIYYDHCLMVNISSGQFPAIRLPAAFLS